MHMRIPLMDKSSKRNERRSNQPKNKSKTIEIKISKRENNESFNKTSKKLCNFTNVNNYENSNMETNHSANSSNPTNNLSANFNDFADSLSNINDFIKSAVNSFNEPNKDSILQILDNLNNSQLPGNDSEILVFIKLINELITTPYFHFISIPLRSLLFKILCCSCKVQKEIKLFSFEILFNNFDSKELFHSFICLYSSIDILRVSNASFRNYCLLKCLTKVVVTNQELINFSFCIQDLENCIPFVEYLTRTIEVPICRYLLILISYDFLRNVKGDLLSLKLQDVPKDLNDSVISKVFTVFPAIKSEFESNEVMNGNDAINAVNDDANVVDRNGTNDNKAVNDINAVTDVDKAGTDAIKAVNDTCSMSAENTLSDLLIKLFNCTSIRTILLSIYKRLFFYFLIKNKRLFQTGKVFKIFSKNEKTFIYKHIKTHRTAFINIFKQIDHKFIIKEALKSDINLNLLINQEKLESSELSIFYNLCFSYVQKHRDFIKMKVFSPFHFCSQFNKCLDKSFIKYIEIHFIKPLDLKCKESLKFINEFNIFNISNRKVNSFVDPVALVSELADCPGNLFIKSNIEQNILILNILCNTELNVLLVKRLVPVLRKLILYKEYTLYSGRLYYFIYKTFNMTDPLFTSDILHKDLHKNICESLIIKAGLNNNTFEESFIRALSQYDTGNSKNKDRNRNDDENRGENRCDNSNDENRDICENDTDPNSIINVNVIYEYPLVIVNSIIFYLYYNPTFSFEYPQILSSALQMKNQSTFYLLEYLKMYVNNNSSINLNSCTSFIVESLSSLYDLYFYFEVINNSLIFPFQSHVLEILFGALKLKVLLPCMAIPYVLTQHNCNFIYKNYLESCVNCINDCLYVTSSSIRESIRKIKAVTRIENEVEMDNKILENESFVPELLLKSLFNLKLANNFIYSLSLVAPLKKILSKLDYQDDILSVFIVLRQLREFGKSDKKVIISHILENISDEQIMKLIEDSKDFYEKNSRGELPIHFIF